jgi:hypothetical protein
MYLLAGEIRWLLVEWTSTLVGFHHSYNDFDRLIRYGCCLELQLSLHLAVQTRHFLQTIGATRRNGHYIWVSEMSTRWLDQILQIFQASLLLLVLFLWNSTWKDMEKQLPWRNNKSTMKRLWAWFSSLFIVLLTRVVTLESLCFVWTVGGGNNILSSVHGRLTTLKRFTCKRSTNPISLCAKNLHCRLEKGIHCRGNWETIGYTSKNW